MRLVWRHVSTLLAYLGFDVKVLSKALAKLEGAGLLETLYKQKSGREFYVFRLIEPLSVRQFFNDDLLSVDLLEMVGEKRFVTLNRHLVPAKRQFKDWRDLSHNFLDAYNIGRKPLHQLPAKINQIRRRMATAKLADWNRDYHELNQNNDFNFQLLWDELENDPVNLNQVKRHANLILLEHTIYGIDEISMRRFIEKATRLDNLVDFRRFKILIAREFQGNHHKPVQNDHPQVAAHKLNDSDQAKKERDLARVAKSYAPFQFLKNIRQHFNVNWGVSMPEENTIYKIMSEDAFRENRGVINILMYYVTIDLQESYLNFNYIQSIINTWVKAKVNTPEEAIVAIKQHQKKQTRRGHRKSYRRHRIVGKLPYWAKKGYHYDPKKNQATPEEAHRAELIMKKIKKKNL